METRSNNVFVGAIVLLLLAVTIGGAFWFARVGEGDKHEYDIFFKQSVGGLAKGAAVTYSGVPVGQIKDIKLWERDPDFVRVRVAVESSTPVLQGTTATISGVGFTGVNEIQLDGAVRGAPPISCPAEQAEATCPEGVPVIPPRPGALGELLNNAPQLLNRLTTLTERLNELLNDKNQKHISGMIANLDSLTGDLARAGPDLAQTIIQARVTLESASKAAESLANASNRVTDLVDAEGKPLIADLRNTIRSARTSLDALNSTLQEAQPGVKTFSRETMPQVGLLIRDLRRTAQSLMTVTEKLDQQGAGALIGAPRLPDYKP